MNKSVFVGELTWKEYEKCISSHAVVMLPVGALEQHGHHMGMNVDVLLPTAICERVANKINALVFPSLQYGYKSQQKSGGGNFFPGTTSLDGCTMIATVQDIIREQARHGIRQLVLLNGHFENSMFIVEGIDLALRELKYQNIHDFKVMVLSYWDFIHEDGVINTLYPDGFIGWDVEHGGLFETSLMLALYPDLVDLNKVVKHSPAKFPPYDTYPADPLRTPCTGTLSSAENATVEKGQLILDVCVKGISEAIKSEFSIDDAVIKKLSFS